MLDDKKIMLKRVHPPFENLKPNAELFRNLERTLTDEGYTLQYITKNEKTFTKKRYIIVLFYDTIIQTNIPKKELIKYINKAIKNYTSHTPYYI
jgi:hypothetical protein